MWLQLNCHNRCCHLQLSAEILAELSAEKLAERLVELSAVRLVELSAGDVVGTGSGEAGGIGGRRCWMTSLTCPLKCFLAFY